METRSRKRAEASSAAQSSSSQSASVSTRFSKRPRLSAAAAAAAAVNSSLSSRSRRAQVQPLMDHSANESSIRSRRKNQSSEKESDSIKGKEKELDIRARERDRERTLALGLDSSSCGQDDDNDSEGAAGLLHHNFSSASSAIQGLLRKLGAGLDDLLPSSAAAAASSSYQNGRLKKILSGLRAEGEEGRQVEVLTQLCEMLSIGTEESLSSFSVDSFVPVLVGLLNHESNADIMLLAARALTHLCDVLPSSCAAVVHYGAVSCFCARLLTIEYMDLAEQSLQALKKISQEHPTACLRAGALMAVLSYVDFFSTGVQRVALSTAANICKKLPSDAADYVMEAVPLLTNLLQCHDSKVLEYASVCLTRIAEAVASSREKLDELCSHGLLAQAVTLISVSNSGSGQAALSTSTYTGLIHLLSTCARGSPLGARALLLLGISGILKDILSGYGLVSSISVSPALSRPPEQIFEIVTLGDELLPKLPQGTIALPIPLHFLIKGSSAIKKSSTSSSSKQDTPGAVIEMSAREKLLHDQPELLQQFGVDLLPVLLQIYGSSVNGRVRHKCLSVIAKLMYFSTADMIQSLLSITNIPGFLAGVLAWKDPQILIPAIQIAGVLMEKLAETFRKLFVREGVIHAVDMLICSDTSSTAQPSPVDFDTSRGTSLRSRRSRRRNGGTNSDSGVHDEIKVSTPGGSAPSASLDASPSNLRSAVISHARYFRDKYFPADPEVPEVGVTDDLLHLKNLCSKLKAGVDDSKSKAKGKCKASCPRVADISSNNEEYLIEIISEMLSELSKGDGVSTFEFIGSGVVSALLSYFSCGTFSKDKVSEANLSKLRAHAHRRFKSFLAISLPTKLHEERVPMTVLVRKLQNALSSLERFHVVLSHSTRSSSGSARLSSGLSALAQPFKLKLCRAPGDKSLRDYSSNVVLIDPLARLAAVEEFLWPKIQRGDSGQKPASSGINSDAGATSLGAVSASPSTSAQTSSGRRHSTRSRSSVIIGGSDVAITASKRDSHEGTNSSVKGKGKAIQKSAADEGKRPQTRNATRRRAVSEKNAQAKPVHDGSSSEDEDMDISPVEIGDALVIEEDDVSEDEDVDPDEVLRDELLSICKPEKVHDVKLGDSADDSQTTFATTDGQINPSTASSQRVVPSKGSVPTEFKTGAFSSRGAMSFAAAAMAGLASTSGRGIRSSRDKRGFLIESSNDQPKLVFSAGGKPLNRDLTIYQAIQKQLVPEDDEDERYSCSDFVSSSGNRLWSDIYTITYQKADASIDQASTNGSSSTMSKLSQSEPALTSGSDNPWRQTSLLDSILQGELPCDMEKSNSTYEILALLRVLEGFNQLAPRLRMQAIFDDFAEGKISTLDELSATGAKVPQEEFISNKLTPKLARQLQDALALCSGSLPSWCHQLTKACPFLFPFETRRQYFYSTALGLSRALHRLQQQQGSDGHSLTGEREVRIGRLQRQKVRVSRKRILDSALKVMEMYSSQKAVLEVEYFGEVGTGLGPTLEFYTLLSVDLQKVELGMWRCSHKFNGSMMEFDGDEHFDQSTNTFAAEKRKSTNSTTYGEMEIVEAPHGLFPRPYSPNMEKSGESKLNKVVEYFRLLGRVMAKALQDGRLLDLPLSTAFYKLVIGQELDLHDILSFDPELGKNLQEMQALVSRKKYLESAGGDNYKKIADFRFRGVPIEDLCLDFTLPGYSDYLLKRGREDEMVDIHKLEEYVLLVVEATVKAGIKVQMEAFRAGFNQVFDITSLQIFSPFELDYMLCGRRELWEVDKLVEHIKFDHGYTVKSPAILNLLDIMGSFTPEQQRAFCQFVTGAPMLPHGGLAVLNPKLTIVRKHPSSTANVVPDGTVSSESADDDLPSVMTCANYLKLPPYSTKEIMYNKLMYALSEGQGSFDLS